MMCFSICPEFTKNNLSTKIKLPTLRSALSSNGLIDKNGSRTKLSVVTKTSSSNKGEKAPHYQLISDRPLVAHVSKETN